MIMEILFEDREQLMLNYYCLITHTKRYDFAIGYTELFRGKSLVTSLQNGNMVLLSQEDINEYDHWVAKLGIEIEDIPEFKGFFIRFYKRSHFKKNIKNENKMI